MRFLGVGDCADLGSVYLRLVQQGHEVRMHAANPLCRDTLAGLVVGLIAIRILVRAHAVMDWYWDVRHQPAPVAAAVA